MKLLSILLIVATIMCLTNISALASTTAPSDVVTASDAGGGALTQGQVLFIVLVIAGVLLLLSTVTIMV